MLLLSQRYHKIIFLFIIILLLGLMPASNAISANGWSTPIPISGT